MESRRVRVRGIDLYPLRNISVRWVFLADQFSVFQDFFVESLFGGELSFLLATIEPSATPGKQRRIVRSYAFLEDPEVHSDGNFVEVAALLEEGADGVDDIVTEEDNPFWVDPSGGVPFLVWSGTGYVPFVLQGGEELHVRLS